MFLFYLCEKTRILTHFIFSSKFQNNYGSDHDSSLQLNLKFMFTESCLMLTIICECGTSLPDSPLPEDRKFVNQTYIPV